MARNPLADPANFTKGGFFTPGRYLINLAEHTTHQPKDKDDKPVGKAKCTLHVNASLVGDDKKPITGADGKPVGFDRYWNIGDMTDFVPANEENEPTPGEAGTHFTLAPKSTKNGVFEGSGYGMFIHALINGGYDRDRLTDEGAYGLNGCIITFKEVPDDRQFDRDDDAPVMAGMEKAKQQVKQKRTIVLPDEVLSVPKKVLEGKAVAVPDRKKAGEAQGSKPANNGTPVNKAPVNTANNGSGGDVDDDDVVEFLTPVLADYLTKQAEKGKVQVMKALVFSGIQTSIKEAPEAMKTAAMGMWKNTVKSGAILESIGWKLDGDFVKLAD